MTILVLGNRNAIHSLDHGETFQKMPKGKRATYVEIPDDRSTLDAVFAVVKEGDQSGVWTSHASPGAKPAWVASDNPALAALVADHYGCEVRDLEQPVDSAGNPVPGMVVAALATLLTLPLAALAVATLLLRSQAWLKTNGGNDFQAAQMAGSASATAVAKFMAITANAAAESASDTTLTAEIATAGGGLLRQTAVYAHTASAANYTLTGTFTANGSDSLPVTVAKMGVFTATSAGTMVFEKLLTTTATLSASGDNVVITQTVTM